MRISVLFALVVSQSKVRRHCLCTSVVSFEIMIVYYVSIILMIIILSLRIVRCGAYMTLMQDLLCPRSAFFLDLFLKVERSMAQISLEEKRNRDLTQSYDKSPYINRKFKKQKQLTIQIATKTFIIQRFGPSDSVSVLLYFPLMTASLSKQH